MGTPTGNKTHNNKPVVKKYVPHPLCQHVHAQAELDFLSSLGNTDPLLDNARPVVVSKKPKKATKFVASKQTADGERITADQQEAIFRCLAALDAEQEELFEIREATGLKMARVAKKLGEAVERTQALETENAAAEATLKQVKHEIATRTEDRERSLKALDQMRQEVDETKNRTVISLDMRVTQLRAQLREVDRQVKQAIWASGGSGVVTVGVGAETPLPPVPPIEPIVLRPILKRLEYDDHVAAPRGRLLSADGRPSTSCAATYSIRKYNLYASLSLKDVKELGDHAYRHPLLGQARQDLQRAASTRSLDLFNKLLLSNKKKSTDVSSSPTHRFNASANLDRRPTSPLPPKRAGAPADPQSHRQ